MFQEPPPQPTPPAAPQMPYPPMIYVTERIQFEYKVITRAAKDGLTMPEAEMNALGADGWELAAALSGEKEAAYYFKRVK